MTRAPRRAWPRTRPRRTPSSAGRWWCSWSPWSGGCGARVVVLGLAASGCSSRCSRWAGRSARRPGHRGARPVGGAGGPADPALRGADPVGAGDHPDRRAAARLRRGAGPATGPPAPGRPAADPLRHRRPCWPWRCCRSLPTPLPVGPPRPDPRLRHLRRLAPVRRRRAQHGDPAAAGHQLRRPAALVRARPGWRCRSPAATSSARTPGRAPSRTSPSSPPRPAPPAASSPPSGAPGRCRRSPRRTGSTAVDDLRYWRAGVVVLGAAPARRRAAPGDDRADRDPAGLHRRGVALGRPAADRLSGGQGGRTQQPWQTFGLGRVKARQQVRRCTVGSPVGPGTSSTRSARSSAPSRVSMVCDRRAGQAVGGPQDAVRDAGGDRAEQRPGADPDLRLDRRDHRGQVGVEQRGAQRGQQLRLVGDDPHLGMAGERQRVARQHRHRWSSGAGPG